MRIVEVEDVCKSIHEWVENHERKVIFYGMLEAYDKKGELVEGAQFVYGNKKAILILMKEQMEKIKKQKKKFINW